jgi:ferredoxin
MIVAERKPYDQIRAMIRDAKKVLVFGCGGCVTVCSTGGEKEAEVLASELSITDQKEGIAREYVVKTVERQCEREFLREAAKEIDAADAVLSLACGAGVNLLAEEFAKCVPLPAMNTTFLAANDAPGVYVERCRGCGDCVLHITAGLCPVARCAKNIQNGPCGGTHDGKCEISTDENVVDCVWALIVEKLKSTGRLDSYREFQAARDWRPAGHGGLRKMIREDLKV